MVFCLTMSRVALSVGRRRLEPSPEGLIGAARRRFLKGERLDIAGLADEVGVSRATAYRWACNVDTLTGRVIAGLAEETVAQSRRVAQGRGATFVLEVLALGLRAISSLKPYRDWLEHEDPQTALRIVASKESPVQATTIRLVQGLLEEEVARGHLRLALDAHAMAYALVRISESFLYADLIAGEEPDIDKAVEIHRLLLQEGRGPAR